jgi:hypothetical protein
MLFEANSVPPKCNSHDWTRVYANAGVSRALNRPRPRDREVRPTIYTLYYASRVKFDSAISEVSESQGSQSWAPSWRHYGIIIAYYI